MSTKPRPLNAEEMAAWRGFVEGAMTVVRRLDDDLEGEHGLRRGEYAVLVQLSEASGRRMRMCDLAGETVLSPSGLTRLVDRLVKDGLVRREVSAEDARVTYAVLSRQGLERLEEAYPTHLRGVREYVIDRLTVAERRALATAMAKLRRE